MNLKDLYLTKTAGSVSELFHTLTGSRGKLISRDLGRVNKLLERNTDIDRMNRLISARKRLEVATAQIQKTRNTAGRVAKVGVGGTGITGGAYEVGKHKNEGEQNLTLNGPYDV